MLYVGIIAAIQGHVYDHCRGNMSGHVYIYPNPLGHTLKSFASIEYEFGIIPKKEGDSKSGSRSLRMFPLYHGWFRKGPKPWR
jgi:hypothetical protein